MARDLKGAIRLAKFKVDECRRAVSDLQGLEAEMLSRIEAFEAEFAREKAAAAALDGIAFTMEGYLD
ncbi:MAG: flagellar export protein FliJ, partial [Rhodospirillaceae bacterium]